MVTIADGNDLIEAMLCRADVSEADRRRIRERLELIRGVGHALPEDTTVQRIVLAMGRTNWIPRARVIYAQEVSENAYEFLKALVADGLPPPLVPIATTCAMVLLRREDIVALARTCRRHSANAHAIPVLA